MTSRREARPDVRLSLGPLHLECRLRDKVIKHLTAPKRDADQHRFSVRVCVLVILLASTLCYGLGYAVLMGATRIW